MIFQSALTDGWTGSASSDQAREHLGDSAFAAVVPGSVHADLLAVGLIPDPFDGDNESTLHWIGDSDFTYATTFDRPPGSHDRVDLVLHGLDTVADIAVNGVPVAHTENMHRTYRVPLSDLLDNANTLEISFTSPRRHAASRIEALGARPSQFSDYPPFIRKMACDFGWDWGPDLATSGIWRPVELQAWSIARIASVRPIVSVAGTQGTVRFEIELERTAEVELEVSASVGGTSVTTRVAPGARSATLVAEVHDAHRWWPRGLGNQTMYDAVVELNWGIDPLDRWESRIGFRELVVEQIEDADHEGSGFRVIVNGEPLFVRGVNWIPDNSFIATVDEAQYRKRLTQATELGANLVRVWGGGCFESDEFYSACDELGLLVWQDFLFACAAYPEEGEFPAEIAAEARDNVTRIMPHPSLALWNGNNENVWFWFLRDWKNVLEGSTWGALYYFDLLPSIVAELDPERFYLAASPYSGSPDREPNDPRRGVVHSWIPGDYREYEAIRPRFVSEFGFQGPPTRELFDSVVHDAQPAPFSPGSVQRQKADYGTERIEDILRVHLGVPTDFDEWYWLAQLNQARAVGFGIDYFRSLAPWCSGTVVWQLNDCWPAISWSVIDYAERWKPAAYAMRRAFADRVATVHLIDGQPQLALGNETREPWTSTAHVERWNGSGPLERSEIPVGAAVRSTAWFELGLAAPLGEDELLVVTVDGIRATMLGGVDKDFADQDAEFTTVVTPAAGGVTVTLTAGTVLRDVCLFPGSLDENAHCDRNLITLLPGESETWHIATGHPERFSSASVQPTVRSARAAR